MKILIAADTYYPQVNGASYFTQRLAFYLKNKGHEVLVLAPSQRIRTELTRHNDIPVYGVRSFSIPGIRNFRYSPPFYIDLSLETTVKLFNPDVIHIQSHFFIGNGAFRIAKKYDIPIVGTNHFMPENILHYIHVPQTLKKGIKNLAWMHFRGVFDRLDYITTPTQKAADLAAAMGFSKPIVAVSNGIDLERFNPQKKDEVLRNKLGLPEKPLLLYVGRLDKEKNVEQLIRAINLLPRDFEIKLIIAGDGQERRDLEKLADTSIAKNKIKFLGFVRNEDLPALYCLADAFIIACPYELQSLVTMEAMASGLPIIAVDALALPELVHDGENGFLFKQEDIQGMADSILKLFSDKELRNKMSGKSLEIIRAHDINKTIENFESIYNQLI